jgi:hypothetical protein
MLKRDGPTVNNQILCKLYISKNIKYKSISIMGLPCDGILGGYYKYFCETLMTLYLFITHRRLIKECMTICILCIYNILIITLVYIHTTYTHQ